MDILFDALKGVSATTLITWVLCLFAIVGSISGISIKAYNLLQKWRQAENEKEEKEDKLQENTIKIQTLENKVDTLIETFQKYLQEDKKDKQALLRDNIQAIYNDALKNRYITNEGKKNYGYLYERYTANDGNSYIVDTVNPYIQSLPIFASHSEAKAYYDEHGTYK